MNAQYYDMIFPPGIWAQQDAALRALLPGARTVAEIGPGTGHFTAVIAGLVPDDGEVFAVEPLPVMRAALATRLGVLPDAAAKVTVLPTDALAMALPEPVDAVVMMNVLTHFPRTTGSCCGRGARPRCAPAGCWSSRCSTRRLRRTSD